MVHFYQDLKYLVEVLKALVAKIEERWTIATIRTFAAWICICHVMKPNALKWD